ncbi:hypothetical protein [Halobacterium litoreum]|uniref:PGF-CTERM protein n=1 Tax=Halobacterium litoreum TaxID=2039234 RepID=A0ABD5NBZ6_9EURY|nr:hypothetical protein [Halobacterium litoreum]UHH14306.1 hypothetical protein LT972_04725 [Halobacterium litoreum]
MGTSKTAALVLAGLVLFSAVAPASGTNLRSEQNCQGEVWTGVETLGEIEVQYTITFDQSERLVCVSAENVGEKKTKAGYGIQVDDRTVRNLPSERIAPGETFSAQSNITGWIDVTAENHTVRAGTYAGTAVFNFTERFDESEEGGFPSPYITDVEVLRNQSSGETTLEVTATNPANRSYYPSLLVKTFETPTSRDLPNRPDNHTLVYHVPLEESPGETVVGELKLYEHWKRSDGKFDREEFVANPNGTDRSWERAFEEVPNLSDMNEEVYYENESAKKYRDQGPDVKPISERASRIGAVATVVLVVGGLGLWRRRKRR